LGFILELDGLANANEAPGSLHAIRDPPGTLQAHKFKDRDEGKPLGLNQGQERSKWLDLFSTRKRSCAERLSEVSRLKPSGLTGFLFNEEGNVIRQASLEELVPLPHP
jgi:hypothetical protein